MKMNRSLHTVLLAAILALLSACQDADAPPDGMELPAPLSFDENPVVAKDCREGDGTGIVVMREGDKNRLYLVVDLAAGTSGAPIQPPPMLVARPVGEAFEGKVVHCQLDTVETGNGPRKRLVVVAEEGTPPNVTTAIHTFDEQGALAATVRKPGAFNTATRNPANSEKLFTTLVGTGQHWVVVDLTDGGKQRESRTGLGRDDVLVDVETVGEHTVVIQRWRGGIWIRIRVFGPDGTLLHALDMPGLFRGGLDNGRNLKAIVTEHEGTVYQDLVEVVTGTWSKPFVGGLPQNGLTGTHRHLQHDTVGGEDRFVEIVYDPGRKETTVRILDGQGRIRGTHVHAGDFKGAVAAGGRKVVAIERPGQTDAATIDLASGNQCAIFGLPGAYGGLGHDPASNRFRLTAGGRTEDVPGC
ncbi:MAG: hypothetical protein HOH66_00985 [Rhodospirillaceae bacterium]|jgi:hypothetical protein|nr:hypothetical protein [Rhodospirillaceae bacterium]MBT6116422.1 hypothetical protein [Rhodospirillaceae bacterium]